MHVGLAKVDGYVPQVVGLSAFATGTKKLEDESPHLTHAYALARNNQTRWRLSSPPIHTHPFATAASPGLLRMHVIEKGAHRGG